MRATRLVLPVFVILALRVVQSVKVHGRRTIFPLTKLIAWRIRIEYSILPDAAAPSCPSREELTGSSRFFLALLLRPRGGDSR